MSFTRLALERTWDDLEARLAHRVHHPHPSPTATPVIPVCPMAHIRVVNRSKVVSGVELAAAVQDLQTQVCSDFAPHWLIEAAVRVDDASSVKPGEWLLFVEDDATIPGALGYHDVEHGVPTGHVFARTSAANGVGWASVASHELLEMLGDPRTVLAGIDDPTGTGRSGRILMAEACDPVEQSTYTVGNTVVSNFVTPAWWDATAAGPFDFLDRLTAPLQLLPGGSFIGEIEFTSAVGWKQRTAEKAPTP